MTLKAPFPYFGGKSTVANLVWQRFGDPLNYIEPFCGSAAVLLARPTAGQWETVNDVDGYLTNAYRAIKQHPAELAAALEWPVLELDLHARHKWLLGIATPPDIPAEYNTPELRAAFLAGWNGRHRPALDPAELKRMLETDPDYADVQAAAWWIWGKSAWIGGDWCDQSRVPNRQLMTIKGGGAGVMRAEHSPVRQIMHLKGAQGVVRSRPSLRPAQGVLAPTRKLVDMSGKGVHRKRPAIGRQSLIPTKGAGLAEYIATLSERLRRVRIACGDWRLPLADTWARICGPSPTYKIGLTAVFLDPPYHEATGRVMGLYVNDSGQISDDVRRWCLEPIEDTNYQGPRYAHPLLRIALCGYEGEHEELAAHGWDKMAWQANGGYANQNTKKKNNNRTKEVIWFSPHCLKPETTEAAKQLTLI